MAVFDHPDFDNHERVFFKTDANSGLKAIIAIHNTQRGPALGGCRMFPYASSEEALSDVLRLSRSMTYKAAMAGLQLGGGKAVIIGDPAKTKTKELLHAMADFVDELSGCYITAEDSGTLVEDMRVMAERTRYVAGFSQDNDLANSNSGDPSPTTALGVFLGLKAAVDFKLGADLQDVKIAIQGIGKVGYALAELLVGAGAEILVSDINPMNVSRAVEHLGAKELAATDSICADVDVLAPCAMGNAINEKTLPLIKAKVIAGSANNQLATPEMGRELMNMGILYAPDYVINAGGLIDVHNTLYCQRDEQMLQTQIQRIADTLMCIFKRSEKEQLPTNTIVDLMAKEILEKPSKDSKAA